MRLQFPLLALLVATEVAAGPSSLHVGYHAGYHARIPSPDAPTTLRHTLRGHVWEPSFSVDAAPAAHTSAGVLNLHFRQIHDVVGTHATTIYVGSPPQPLVLYLNMLTADLMVLNHELGDSHRFYDHDKSTTYQANGTSFHRDQFTGFVSRDVITLGDPATKRMLEAGGVSFVEITGRDPVLEQRPIDGCIGFGLHPATMTGAPSFVRKMIKDEALDEPIVGFYFAQEGANVLVGGADSSFIDGKISYFSTHGVSLWSVPLTGISVAGKAVADATGLAVLDTSLFITGPKHQVDAIAAAVGAKNGALPCHSDGPEITLWIGDDLRVTLSKQDYALPTSEDNVCRFAFIGLPADRWFFGLPFLRKVYTVLDYGSSEAESRTGIALAKSSPLE